MCFLTQRSNAYYNCNVIFVYLYLYDIRGMKHGEIRKYHGVNPFPPALYMYTIWEKIGTYRYLFMI